MEKVAIITGAAGNGIGRSTALSLAKAGFKTIINYRSNENNARTICSYINNNGGDAGAIKANVFIRDDCDYLIDETLKRHNRIDACIIGPGAGWNPEIPENLDPEKALSDIMQEIKPIYFFLPKIIKAMKKNGGSIVGIASNPDMPSPAYSYNAAKNSRINALLGLVGPCWKQKIRINIVAPGPVDHFNDFQSAINALDKRDFSKISPQDVAETISFLCSDKGAYLTGNVIKFNF